MIIALIGLGAQYIFFNYPVSAGKRVGNLTKLSTRGKILKTWEGTLNEGYGDKLTTYFSISSNKIAEELFEFEGKEVVIYYEEYLMGWPRDTKYDVIKWEPANTEAKNEIQENSNLAVTILSKTLFCTLLGTIRSDEELYQKVKKHIETNNTYLFNQIQNCNN